MTGIPAAVLATLSTLTATPQQVRDGQCGATGPHMCMHCTHTWEDA